MKMCPKCGIVMSNVSRCPDCAAHLIEMGEVDPNQSNKDRDKK